MTYRIQEDLPSTAADVQSDLPAAARKKPKPPPINRLVSLDAFRGFIMILLAASGFGLSSLARQPEESALWKLLDRPTFEKIAFHFDHPPWQSNFLPGSTDPRTGRPWLRVKVSFWDLIQPAFMFMVGVAMPFSFARREELGHLAWKRHLHALVRAVILVLLGVFLYSLRSTSTNWIFPNVLAQIGLGYFFVYLLLGRPRWVQWTAFAAILVGTWIGIHVFRVPAYGDVDLNRDSADRQELLERAWSAYDPEEVNAHYQTAEVFSEPYRQWSKNGNAFHYFDLWFLNLFPRPTEEDPVLFNSGGYTTLNFVPSMATILLGLFCGQLMLAPIDPKRRFWILVGASLACLALGVFAGATCCPIVKRIWTPAWVLFSGGYVIGMLAVFYLLFDLWPLKRLAFPLVVVGMNSIVVYMLGQLSRTWLAEKVVSIHFGWAIEGFLGFIAAQFGLLSRLGVASNDAGPVMAELFSPVVTSLSALVVIWLICLWLYQQRIFIRI